MTIQDFLIEGKKRLTGELKDIGVENYVVTTADVVKTNDTRLHGLSLREEDSIYGVTVYCDDLYERSEAGEDRDEIMNELVYRCMYSISVPKPPVTPAMFEMGLDDIRSCLTVRLLDTVRNKSYMSGKPYIDVGCGLALTAVINAEPSIMSEWVVSVTHDLLDALGCDSETLLTEAFENTMKIEPPVLIDLHDFRDGGAIFSLKDRRNLLEDSDCLKRDPSSTYVLTNRSGWLGATVLFYPGIMKKLHEMLGEYYLIPSSVHEFMVIPDTEDITVQGLHAILAEGNQCAVEEGDVLSYNIYCYDAADDRLKIAA